MNGENDKLVTIKVSFEVDSEVDVNALAESLFNYLADDPDDLFPGIMVVLDYEVEQADARD